MSLSSIRFLTRLAVKCKPNSEHLETVRRYCGHWLPTDESMLQKGVLYLREMECYYRNYKVSPACIIGNCKFYKSECVCEVPSDELYLFCRLKCDDCTWSAKKYPLSYKLLAYVEPYFFLPEWSWILYLLKCTIYCYCICANETYVHIFY